MANEIQNRPRHLDHFFGSTDNEKFKTALNEGYVYIISFTSNGRTSHYATKTIESAQSCRLVLTGLGANGILIRLQGEKI
jgi:hypothetical protein